MFDLKKAIELAKICKALDDNPSKFSTVYDNENARFCVVEMPEYYVFAFCATNDIKDVLQDFKYFQNDGVHAGFLAHWELSYGKCTNELWKALSSGKKIYLTGHSLGGAVALIWAEMLTGENAEIYTFGCPRVGNDAFSESIKIPHFRVVNGIDLITNLPPAHLPINPYKHHGQLVRLDYRKKLQFDDPSFWDGFKDATYGIVNDIIDRDTWPDNIEDHFLENYIDGLENNL
jgi:pimeloyl-ACP methyl ester carboxylesterase